MQYPFNRGQENLSFQEKPTNLIYRFRMNGWMIR